MSTGLDLFAEPATFVATATRVEFFVPGIPATAGSKKAIRHPKTGRILLIDSCKQARPWRLLVQSWAMEAMANRPLMSGPLILTAEFRFARAQWHASAKGGLKPSAPKYPTTRPDTTKCLRALEDALTGIVWHDDAQVVDQHAGKRYAEQPGVQVTVEVA